MAVEISTVKGTVTTGTSVVVNDNPKAARTKGGFMKGMKISFEDQGGSQKYFTVSAYADAVKATGGAIPASGFSYGDDLDITVPAAAGGSGAGVNIKVYNGVPVAAGNAIGINAADGNSLNTAKLIKIAINGGDAEGQSRPSDGGVFPSGLIVYASSGGGQAGVAGISATFDGTNVSYTATTAGVDANSTVIAAGTWTPGGLVGLSNGADPTLTISPTLQSGTTTATDTKKVLKKYVGCHGTEREHGRKRLLGFI